MLVLSLVLLSVALRADAFGHGLLPLFQLNSSYTNLNAGSYGVVPRVVTANATAWEQRVEENPDAFFRYDVWALMDGVRKLLSSYLRCAWQDLVFVPNASAGVNTVLRSFPAPPGKKIMFLNTAYGMVKSTIAYVDPTSRLEVNLTLPATPASVLATVTEALIANASNIYLASFSHIASLPALVLPVKELTALCHAHGVLVLIDGAHALGHIPVDIADIDADFWLGNGHKWLYSPKGSAVLWVRRSLQPLVRPLTISWDEGEGVSDFQNMFSYQGTASYTPYLAMAAAMDFRASIGGDAAIMTYLHDTAEQAGALLAHAWGTSVLEESDMHAGMIDVRLPTSNATLALALPAELLARYGTWVPTYDLGSYGGMPGEFFVRVSVQVFTEMSDAQMLADAVLAILKGK